VIGMATKTTGATVRAIAHDVLATRRPPPERRFHAFCVGVSKSGTHSIAGVFAGNYRAQHEPESARLLPLLTPLVSNAAPGPRLRLYLRSKDRRLGLEMESSHPLGLVAPLLASMYPDAKFVLTMRHPLGWVDSQINHELARAVTDVWRDWRRARFGTTEYLPEDEPLRERGLFPLAGYLRFWELHNRRVIEGVPPERLLLIPTEQIGEHSEALAAFVGVSPDSLDTTRSTTFPAAARFGIVASLDPAYVEDTLHRCCPLLEEIPSLLAPDS